MLKLLYAILALLGCLAAGTFAVQMFAGAAPTNCAPNPSRCGYPSASNSGVPPGTKLTVLNLPQGHLDVTAPGTVIENKDIRGCVIIKAANVTIRKSKISCPDFTVIYNTRDYHSGGKLLIEDSDITCNTTQGTGMSEYGFTARRVHVYGCENGFSLSDTVIIEDSYIHNLYEGPAGEGHADGIQITDNPARILIRHNTILVPGTTAAVNWTRQTTSVLIQNNLLGGGAYTVYCPAVTIPAGAYQVLDNRFADGMQAYGLSESCGGGDVKFMGNYKDSDLSPVPPT